MSTGRGRNAPNPCRVDSCRAPDRAGERLCGVEIRPMASYAMEPPVEIPGGPLIDVSREL